MGAASQPVILWLEEWLVVCFCLPRHSPRRLLSAVLGCVSVDDVVGYASKTPFFVTFMCTPDAYFFPFTIWIAGLDPSASTASTRKTFSFHLQSNLKLLLLRAHPSHTPSEPFFPPPFIHAGGPCLPPVPSRCSSSSRPQHQPHQEPHWKWSATRSRATSARGRTRRSSWRGGRTGSWWRSRRSRRPTPPSPSATP